MQWTFTKILKDNYSWIIYNDNKEAIVIDCGEVSPIVDLLKEKDLSLKYILVTHSHQDHVGGLEELSNETGAAIVGNGNYIDRLPKVDLAVLPDCEINLLGNKIKVFATPGHCVDHVIYFFEDSKLLFVGDFLFSLGCGRVFEGNPGEMVKSFSILKTFPKDTLIFPSHEYTKANLSFAKALGFFDLGNREKFIVENDVTLPTTLEFEFSCNPFLNLYNEDFKYHVMQNHNIDSVSFFTFLRELKNNKTKLVGG